MKSKLKYLAVSLALLVFLLVVSCGPSALQTAPGKQVILRPQQTAVIETTGLKIQFLKITEDSRCPTGATCIQAGQVDCEVYLTQDSHIYLVTLTQLGSSTQNVAENLGYRFVFNVLPYPVSSQPNIFENYTLVLKVTRAS